MKKITPALLDNKDVPKYWLVKIRTTRGDTTEMKFSNKEAANAQYNQIRSAGVWTGAWIDSIELSDHLL